MRTWNDLPVMRFTMLREGFLLDFDWLIYEALQEFERRDGIVFVHSSMSGEFDIPSMSVGGSYRLIREPMLGGDILEVRSHAPRGITARQAAAFIQQQLDEIAKDAKTIKATDPYGYEQSLGLRRASILSSMQSSMMAMGGPGRLRLQRPGPSTTAALIAGGSLAALAIALMLMSRPMKKGKRGGSLNKVIRALKEVG